MEAKKTIEEIARQDGRYNVKALKFIFEGLGVTVQKIKETRGLAEEEGPCHISGQELSEGLAGLAIERWGRMARTVLNSWGVKNTRDFGEIVYLMINHEWMMCQDNDRIEDFDKVFDFEQVFEKNFDFVIK